MGSRQFFFLKLSGYFKVSYWKGFGNSVQSQGGFKKWPISDVDPLSECTYTATWEKRRNKEENGASQGREEGPVTQGGRGQIDAVTDYFRQYSQNCIT